MASGYIQRSRHGTLFHFRRRVPLDLVEVVDKREVLRSLGTSDRRIAGMRARALAVQYDRLFEALRAMPVKKKYPDALKIDFGYSIEILPSGEIKARAHTDPTDTPDSIAAGTRSLEAAIAAARAPIAREIRHTTPAPRQAPVGPFKRFADAIDEYLAAADLADGSLKNYKGYLKNVALPYFKSDTPIESIGQAEIAAFAARLQDPEWHRTRRKPPARSTLEGYLSALSSMGQWHRQRGVAVPSWSTATLLPRVREPAHQARPQHTLTDLGVLFANASKYRASEPEKFWITVVTAFTGCRVEEMAQVNLSTDLHRTDKGVYYFQLDERADADGEKLKSIKKLSSWRAAPIHSALVRHGFIDFLNATRAAGYTRPYERRWGLRRMSLKIEGRADDKLKKWAHEIVKWGGEELRDLIAIGAVSEVPGRTYFHSMRHTFTTHLDRQAMPAEHRSLLSGHAIKGENAQRYSKLRDDADFLASLVEKHMGAYVELLDAAVARCSK